METKPVVEGWKRLFNARKEHYFIGSRSLCGGWMTLGSGGVSETSPGEARECRECRKRLDKRGGAR